MKMSNKAMKEKFGVSKFHEEIVLVMPNDASKKADFVEYMETVEGYRLINSSYIDNGMMTAMTFDKIHKFDRVSAEFDKTEQHATERDLYKATKR